MPFRTIEGVVIVAIGIFEIVSSTAVHVLFVNATSCHFSGIHQLTEFDSYMMEWKGDALPSNCSFTFKEFDYEDIKNKHTLCVEYWQYNVTDCNFYLQYGNGDFDIPSQRFSCNSVPSKFCADEGRNLRVKFNETLASNSTVVLLLSATRTYNARTQKIIITAIIGGIFLAAFVIGLFLALRFKYKDKCFEGSKSKSGSDGTKYYKTDTKDTSPEDTNV